MGKMRNACSILVVKPEGKRLLEYRPIHRWEDHIRMVLKDSGGMVWTGFVTSPLTWRQHGPL